MPTINRPSESQLPNPSATIARVIFWLFIGCLAWTGVAVLLAVGLGEDRAKGVLAVVMYGGVITGCFSFGLPLGYFAVRSDAKRTEKLRRAILDGHFLVRWRYTPEQWQRFRQFAAKKEDEKLRNLRIGVGAFAGLALIVGAVVGIVQPGHDRAGIIITVSMCAACILVCGIILICSTHFDKRNRQRLSTPQDSYISTLGAYVNGRWILWGTAKNRLIKIRIDEGRDGTPACLEFMIETGEALQGKLVLIPPEQIALARKVVAAVEQAPESKGGGGMNKATAIMRIFTETFR